MGQRKLTDEELRSVLNARHHLRMVSAFACDPVQCGVLLCDLDLVALHCTTDGKPWTEPQPEIGEGYRLGTGNDAWRLDLDVLTEKGWEKTGPGFVPGFIYRVPVDRIPTDEDARQRPTVMVRDREDGPWLASKLLGVVPEYEYQFASNMCGVTVTHRMARFPYPGELD